MDSLNSNTGGSIGGHLARGFFNLAGGFWDALWPSTYSVSDELYWLVPLHVVGVSWFLLLWCCNALSAEDGYPEDRRLNFKDDDDDQDWYDLFKVDDDQDW